MQYGCSDFLMHYGVPGQKWGVKTKEYEPVAIDHRRSKYNSFNSSATYKPGSQTNNFNSVSKYRANVSQKNNFNNVSVAKSDAILKQRPKSEEQIKAEKEKVQNVIKVAGAVALTALAGFALYKGVTKLNSAMNMRHEVYKNFYAANRNAAFRDRGIAINNGSWTKGAEKAFWRNRKAMNKEAFRYLLTGK